ncbi:hypothetical protein ACJIZ3_015338 [Penstemon smallii]|uniref:Exocyst subunit Exo70 family protein n=1 Tax=Penstemon smallii TaxID=265156 RepID=A0ABD3RM75_9LAMI
MDAEKEKPLPEKSSTFVARDNAKTDNQEEEIINTTTTTENDSKIPDPNQDSPHDDATESKPENADDSETKEEEEEEEEEQAECPLPPDLNKVSEEIDQFISTLSSLEKDESTHAPPDVPIFVEQFDVLVEAMIEEYDSKVKLSQLKEEDSSSFLETVNRVSSLSKALSLFSSEYKYAYSINRIGGVKQRAMSYLEEEFKFLLDDYKIHESDLVQENPPPEPSPKEEKNNLSDEILTNLIKLSRSMFAAEYEKECCQVYFVARRNVLEEKLHKLGFEKYSIDDVQKMQWESLEREIEVWIKTFKQCATILFSNERKLCDSIFSDNPSVSENLFGTLSHGVIEQLLNFSAAVALTKRAPEKLFKFLDIYEALRDILPQIENLFPEEWVNEPKTETSMLKSRLGEAMISIVIELENSIKNDSGKTPVPGGAVHPLTKYIMNYLTYACEYRETLEQVFREHQKSAIGSEYDYNQNNESVKQSPFQSQITKVMDLLDMYLEGKSKLYKDHALSSIFLMNNGRYILQKIKGSNELNSLMGSHWCRKRSSELRQYHKTYQRETWGRLINCLNPEGLLVNGKVVKPVLKERFTSFNAMFNEIHKTQSTWVVGDEQLQSELRVSISNMVIPAYRSFLGRFSQVFTPGRQTEKYVKYQADDIETNIDELFDGNATPMGRRKL